MTEQELLAELGLLYNHTDDDSRQFTRWQMTVAIAHGMKLGCERAARCAEHAIVEHFSPSWTLDTRNETRRLVARDIRSMDAAKGVTP